MRLNAHGCGSFPRFGSGRVQDPQLVWLARISQAKVEHKVGHQGEAAGGDLLAAAAGARSLMRPQRRLSLFHVAGGEGSPFHVGRAKKNLT